MKLITWHEMKSEKSSTLKRAIAAFRSKNPGFYTPVKTKVQALNESSSAATGGNATPQEGAR